MFNYVSERTFLEIVLMAVCAIMVPVFVYASLWCANFTTWYIICYVAEKFIPGLLADIMRLIGLVSVAFGIDTVVKRNAC